MTGRTHLLIGVASGIFGAAHAPTDNLLRAAIVGAAVFAALLPDIDHPRAIISGYAPGVGQAARLFISHRGATHTILFAALCMGLLFAVHAPVSIAAAAGAGILSHLVADMLTVQGVPLLMPLSRRAFKLLPYAILSMTSWIFESFAVAWSVVTIGFVVWGKL